MLGWEILSHLFFLQKLSKKVDLAVSLNFFLSTGDRVFVSDFSLREIGTEVKLFCKDLTKIAETLILSLEECYLFRRKKLEKIITFVLLL